MKLRKERRSACASNGKVTAWSLLSFLTATASAWQQQAPAIEPWVPLPIPATNNVHDFTLRHIFHRGTYQDPNLHVRADIDPPSADGWLSRRQSSPHFQARSKPMTIERLADRQQSSIENYLSYARQSGKPAILGASAWTRDEVDGPDYQDKDTIVNLAYMAANAYVTDHDGAEWTNVTQGFNESQSFGWQGDGLRGHIFATKNNDTIVVSLKGTSPAVFDGDGTTTKDKLNDNLFFSCCCGSGGQYFWRQACDCYSSTYTCNSTCLGTALRRENRYYRASIELYTNVTELYPHSNVWLVGHSLGGSVSSLLGMTYGLPTVTFEAPGDDLAAKRLGLPRPPTDDSKNAFRRPYAGSVHIGHTADPIFMGTCNGATAACTLGGYAMESQCHTGLQCVYDTVQDNGWRVGIGNHKVHNVIDNVIKKYDKVPKCVPDDECVDCFNWKYFESNGSDSTTTSTTMTSTAIKTRTTTCKTPGWWGCLDETTTGTSASTSVITTTYTTETCISPGWFGCNEEKNITVTTTTAPPTTSPVTTTGAQSHHTSVSTSCAHPGFWGCRDSSPSSTVVTPSVSQTASAHSCETPGIFFGCYDRTTFSTSTHPITSAPTITDSISSAPTATNSGHKKRRKCKHRIFFGLICADSGDDGVAASPTASSEEDWNSEL